LPLVPPFDQGRANQAAGRERLAPLQGPVDAVKYRMLDRYSAFMMSGDISTGTPFGGATFETLQLPASPPPDASGDRPERTVSLMELHPEKWTSFRVYNRGACSSMQDWQSVAQGFGDALADQLNDDARITHASVTEGLMSVMLRSDLARSDVGAPDDRDQLGVRASVNIERLQGDYWTDCRDLTFDVHFTVELEHTDRMQLPVQNRAFAVACRLGDELLEYDRHVRAACRLPGLDDSFWLDPARTKVALGTNVTLRPGDDGVLGACAVTDGDAQVFRNRVIHQAYQITSDLANGRAVTCDPGAQMFFSLEASDWTLRRHRELSGRGASEDPLFLLGLATMDGHDLGAHDTVARVVSVNVENFHDGPNGNCNPGPVSHVRKRNIINSIKGKLRNSLPLALNAAFMSGAVQEPYMADADSQSWRPCSTDADCDFRARDAFDVPIGPAFQTGYPAVWRRPPRLPPELRRRRLHRPYGPPRLQFLRCAARDRPHQPPPRRPRSGDRGRHRPRRRSAGPTGELLRLYGFAATRPQLQSSASRHPATWWLP